MDEEVVIIHVMKWLEEAHKSLKNVQVNKGNPNLGPDIFVESFSNIPVDPEKDTYTIHALIECKGSDADLDRALGQSLGYYVLFGKVPTYLAVPRNHFRFTFLKEIIETLDLPLGLIQVDENGEVNRVREARGEPITRKLIEMINQYGDK